MARSADQRPRHFLGSIHSIRLFCKPVDLVGERVMPVDERRSKLGRRSGKDRRSGMDSRSAQEKKVVGERRSGVERRSGLDRRSKRGDEISAR